jgi:hypothetical protein
MNYEFHVGDYVETRDGKVGYIYYFRPNVLVFEMPNGEQHEIDADVLDWSDHPENVFKRIGAYDFTKKEKKKIDRLNHNAYVDATIKQLNALKDKINELVDAVNKLMEKEDEE